MDEGFQEGRMRMGMKGRGGEEDEEGTMESSCLAAASSGLMVGVWFCANRPDRLSGKP